MSRPGQVSCISVAHATVDNQPGNIASCNFAVAKCIAREIIVGSIEEVMKYRCT
jgi:hypothetical protein